MEERKRECICLKADVIVIGGGLAGMCTSIAAAREGAKVILIQDRPVLGGNQSSELQVGICGADYSGGAVAQYVRETGIIEELWLERMHRTSEYYTGYSVQDVVFWEAVVKEKNIRLLLNTQAYHAEKGVDGRIEEIHAMQNTTEQEYRVKGSIFVDASGDSAIAADAGAAFRMGRERKDEFGESMAPGVADSGTMGNTMYFRAIKKDHKVEFKRPDWAYDFSDSDCYGIRNWLEQYGDREQFSGFWWIELGGDKDTITDSEEIRDELYKAVFGVWDYLKNHGNYGCDNFDISWMNIIPGKRESRRIEGDYIVTENDVRNSVLFEDRVAYAGWPIDIHPPKGIFGPEPGCTAVMLDDVWSIPFRSLFSKNIPNLMMAGRNISVSHVAMGSSRVMATCALTGQAVGTAAGLCIRYQKLPREIGAEHIKELQQILLKNDCYIKDMKNEDPGDFAREASVRASSQQKLCMEFSDQAINVKNTMAQLIPVSGGKIERAELLLEAKQEKKIQLKVYKTSRINAFPEEKNLVQTAVSTVYAGKAAWVGFDLHIDAEKDMLYWLQLEEDEELQWYGTEGKRPIGTRAVYRDHRTNEWKPRRGYFSVKITPESYPYSCSNVINGVARPETWTNLWVSDETRQLPQYLELEFPEEKKISVIQLTFDTEMDRNLYLEKDYSSESRYLPACVRDYEIYGCCHGQWIKLLSEKGNYQRHKVHQIDEILLDKIQIRVLSTNGDPSAKIYEIRCY